jgi:transcriptional regulator with PAS, ATPase and Fis domain
MPFPRTTLPWQTPRVASDDTSPLIASMQRPEQRAAEALSALAQTCEGAVVVDNKARIAWISPKYRHLLGIASDVEAVGQPVEELIPESRLREVVETGRPQVLDVMRFGERHFVVCRLPILNVRGAVEGAAGFVFYDRLDNLRSIISRFQTLEAHLMQSQAALALERKARYRLSNFIGVSAEVRAVKERARQFAASDGAVLILGETGVGKELLAHALHLASPRANGPFVAVNMAAVPETLLESEFFGVAPGAFTGAQRTARPGKFELAQGGTLFLDEIGDMPLTIQAKFLRVLEEGEFEPLGSNQVKVAQVRVVAATSQDLDAKVKAGSFRSDLYYRLNVLPLRLPPLRARPEDIDPLCEKILDELAPADGGGAWLLTDMARAALRQHPWPGNVRELRNVLQRITATAIGRTLDVDAIHDALGGQAPGSDLPTAAPNTLADVLAEAERAAIVRALQATGGAKNQAAALLGISRSRFYEKLKRYDL